MFQEFGDIDFILLGLSTPRTQRIARIASKQRPDCIVLGIGAGTFKITAGTLKEAPSWMCRSGLQWLYRLLMDPRALWRRYLVGNVLFVLRIIQARFGSSDSFDRLNDH